MSWGLLTGVIAKSAIRSMHRDADDRRRAEGTAPGAASTPRPVSFVVPMWLGVFAGGLLAGGTLVVVANLLRHASGRSSTAEAVGFALLGGLLFGVPGVLLAVASRSAHRRRRGYLRVQALARTGAVLPLVDIARDLGVDEARARGIALEVVSEGHVLGRLDEANRQLVVD